jgi:hypothetical protein
LKSGKNTYSTPNLAVLGNVQQLTQGRVQVVALDNLTGQIASDEANDENLNIGCRDQPQFADDPRYCGS